MRQAKQQARLRPVSGAKGTDSGEMCSTIRHEPSLEKPATANWIPRDRCSLVKRKRRVAVMSW